MSKRPPSNLNPDAEPWGRWVSAEVEETREDLESVRSDIANGERINNSTLDSLATQIREVDSRPSNRYSWANVNSASFGNTSLSVTIPPSVIPPPDDVARWGWINFNVYLTQNVSADTQVDVSMSMAGETLAATSTIVPPGSSWPTVFGNWIVVNALAAFNASPTAPAQIDTQIFLRGISGPSRIVTVSRIATVQYAQPYLPA